MHILPHSTAKFLLYNPAASASDGVAASGALASSQSYCVSTRDSLLFGYALQPSQSLATLPVLLNNTSPKYLQYSIQSFEQSYDERTLFNLTSKDLKLVASPSKRRSRWRRNHFDYDYDEEAEEEEEADFAGRSGTIGQKLVGYEGGSDGDDGAVAAVSGSPKPSELGRATGGGEGQQHGRDIAYIRNYELQPTQSIYAFSVSQPGIVRIERILDSAAENDVRIPHSSSDSAKILVVPCPSAAFSQELGSSRGIQTPVQNACVGDSALSPSVAGAGEIIAAKQAGFSVDVFGYPPLRLTYHRLLGAGNKRESLTIDGIAPDGALLTSHAAGGKNVHKRSAAIASGSHAQQQQLVLAGEHAHAAESNGLLRPQSIIAPLNVSFSTPGSHLYRLDKVVDAFGNALDLSSLRERHGSPSQDGQSSKQPGSDKATESGGKGGKLAAALKGKRSPSIHSLLESAATRRLMVYPRSSVQFLGCGAASAGQSGSGAGQGVKLLKGKKASLQFAIRTEGPPQSPASAAAGLDDTPWNVRVKFTPEASDDEGASAEKGWERELQASRKTEALEVDRPGKYSLVGLDGAHCSGQVLEPSEVSLLV